MLDGVFARGTTPTQIFGLSECITMPDIENFTITYSQKSKVVLVKRKEDTFELNGIDNSKNIVVQLSQSETLMFNPKIKMVEVQIKGKALSGEVFIIGEYKFRLNDCLDEEEL